MPDKGRKRRVFANPSVRNLSIQAGIGEKRKEKFESSFRLPLEFLSILHPFSQGKLSFHPSPSTSSSQFSFSPILSLSQRLVPDRCVPCTTTRNAQHSTCGFNLVNAGPRGSAVVSLIPGHFNRSIERALVMPDAYTMCFARGACSTFNFILGGGSILVERACFDEMIKLVGGREGKVVYTERD